MCFIDTLGIGNFATTTSAFKFRSSMLDEKIPGTLNVGYALPTVAQALHLHLDREGGPAGRWP